MNALLSLPRAGDSGGAVSPAPPASPPPPPPPPRPSNVSEPAAAPVSAVKTSKEAWKWIALAIAALLVLGAIVVIAALIFLRPTKPLVPVAVTPAPTISAVPTPASPPPLSVAPKSASSVLSPEEAEVYVKEFNRDLERGDLKAVESYLDDTVDYYSFGAKDRSFIVEQTKLYLAATPVRAFVVDGVKVQAGAKPTVATLLFDARYSVRDALGNPAAGRTHSEWDVVRRSDGLKIIRMNWMVYPETAPSR